MAKGSRKKPLSLYEDDDEAKKQETGELKSQELKASEFKVVDCSSRLICACVVLSFNTRHYSPLLIDDS